MAEQLTDDQLIEARSSLLAYLEVNGVTASRFYATTVTDRKHRHAGARIGDLAFCVEVSDVRRARKVLSRTAHYWRHLPVLVAKIRIVEVD